MKYFLVICNLSWILITIGILISLVVSFIVVSKRVSKHELVYYLSKIATMKNIVKINHNSKIFDHFNSDGELEGITTKYNRLLNLTTIDGCKEGYKKCGILDTLGNALCIDNNFGCPINKLTVDLLANKSQHLNQGLKDIYNENLIYNYKFYYSNESLDGNSIVSLLFADERPKYITSSNFVVDLAAYKDNYNKNLNNQNNDKDDKGINFGENLISIFVSDIYVEKLIMASFNLISFIKDSDNDKEKFKKYVEKKLETEENKIDKYYLNVGENAYIKNYIGFKSLKDINRFMNFDYNIYKDNYPTKTAYKLGLANGILSIVFFFSSLTYFYALFEAYNNYEVKKRPENKNPITGKEISIVQYNETNIDITNITRDDSNKNKENFQTENAYSINRIKKTNENIKKDEKFKFKKEYIPPIIISAAFIGINLTLLIYSIRILNKNHNNNKKLNLLNNIESDDFIQSFLSEFKNKCKVSSLLICTIILLGSAILIHIIGFIFMWITICNQ